MTYAEAQIIMAKFEKRVTWPDFVVSGLIIPNCVKYLLMYGDDQDYVWEVREANQVILNKERFDSYETKMKILNERN